MVRRIERQRHAVNNPDVDAHAGFPAARNCSSRSRFSSGEGGSVYKIRQSRAAISVKPDVMIERTLACRRAVARVK